MSAVYTVIAYDINTNTRLTELPATQLSFDTQLNNAGSISFQCSLQDAASRQRVAPVLEYGGNPVKVYVDESGVIVWSGWTYTTSYTKSTGILQFGGNELSSWLGQRVQVKAYDNTVYPAGVDPAVLIGTILADTQSASPISSIGLQIVSPASGMPKMVPGYPAAQHSTVQQIISDITALNAPGVGGVDIVVTSQWVGGVPVDTLRVWSPRAGRPAGQTGIVFDLDSCVDYTWPTDATQAANNVTVTGAGTGTSTPTATATTPGLPVGGLGQMPRMDSVVNYSTIQSQQEISLIANGEAMMLGGAQASPTITVPLRGQLGSWMIGDDARVITAGDARFPAGLDEYWRIVQYSVKIPDDGLATVDVKLNQPPIY